MHAYTYAERIPPKMFCLSEDSFDTLQIVDIIEIIFIWKESNGKVDKIKKIEKFKQFFAHHNLSILSVWAMSSNSVEVFVIEGRIER